MGVLRGLLILAFLAVNTIVWATVTMFMAIIRFSVAQEAWRARWGRRMNLIIDSWLGGNQLLFRLLGTMRLEIHGGEDLSRDGWYLVISNHQGWSDIFILQAVYGRILPPLKFFMKRELLWRLPLLGAACYALDFPFMRRYSREFLEKHPELRGQDLDTARQRCERFRPNPTAILIFVEGTRFTSEKHQAQNSPYRHLLRPRAGGIGFVLGAMGDQLHGLVDTTIVYPQGAPTFWEFICGRHQEIRVDIEHTPLAEALTSGDYERDPDHRARVRDWLDGLWQRKDARIETLLRPPDSSTVPRDDG